VRDVWAGTVARLDECSMASQLLCLPLYMDDSHVARRAGQCWYALSSECPYASLRVGADGCRALLSPSQPPIEALERSYLAELERV
jgi:hypothetical protein